MALTVNGVKNATVGRHSDGNGLYLLVKPERDSNGNPKRDARGLQVPASKSWVLRVQDRGERKDYGIGSVVLESVGGDIPLERRKLLSLAEAREKARIGRALAKAGINPSEHWRRAAQADEPSRTFRAVAEECHREAKSGWKDGKHRDEWLSSLNRYAFPIIGNTPVDEVDASAIQKVLLPIWLEIPETARRVKQRIGVVLDHAHAKSWRSSEAPMRAVNQLMRKIKQPKAGHFDAMPYKDLPEFMRKLREEQVSIGRLALQFLILTAGRPGEVRKAKWKEFDLEAGEWRIPPEKMKGGKEHIIPLAPTALAILDEMKTMFAAKPEAFVFPGNKDLMSDATMSKALRTTDPNGYDVHAFRSSFRDWAADNGFNNDWAEAALSHAVAGQEGKTVAAYKRTTFFEHRRDKLMPAWASFVLGDNSKVVQLASARS